MFLLPTGEALTPQSQEYLLAIYKRIIADLNQTNEAYRRHTADLRQANETLEKECADKRRELFATRIRAEQAELRIRELERQISRATEALKLMTTCMHRKASDEIERTKGGGS